MLFYTYICMYICSLLIPVPGVPDQMMANQTNQQKNKIKQTMFLLFERKKYSSQLFLHCGEKLRITSVRANNDVLCVKFAKCYSPDCWNKCLFICLFCTILTLCNFQKNKRKMVKKEVNSQRTEKINSKV